jgi:hypothetical protein
VDDVSVTNTDDDTAGITVGAISGPTTEAGGAAMFTLVLTSEPLADVTIGLSSSDGGEGTVSPASLVFTSANWDFAQTVTVTGQNDGLLVDGDQSYTIFTAAAVSADAKYTGMNANDVAVTNTDNDVPSVDVEPVSGLIVSESGSQENFNITLATQPLTDVVINITSLDIGEVTVSTAQVTFTNADWNQPQSITVTGIPDGIPDPNEVVQVTIQIVPASSDPLWASATAPSVSITNQNID